MPIAEDGSRVSSGFYSALGPGIYRGADGQLHKAAAPMSRPLAQAVRRFADADTERLKDLPASTDFVGTVVSVTPGAGVDGNAALEVRWRGTTLPVTGGYSETYTPGAGDRVACTLLSDGQLIVHGRYIGATA